MVYTSTAPPDSTNNISYDETSTSNSQEDLIKHKTTDELQERPVTIDIVDKLEAQNIERRSHDVQFKIFGCIMTIIGVLLILGVFAIFPIFTVVCSQDYKTRTCDVTFDINHNRFNITDGRTTIYRKSLDNFNVTEFNTTTCYQSSRTKEATETRDGVTIKKDVKVYYLFMTPMEHYNDQCIVWFGVSFVAPGVAFLFLMVCFVTTCCIKCSRNKTVQEVCLGP